MTNIAVLGTLAEFHTEPIPYNMAALVSLVYKIHPDLLCLDITPQDWSRRSFGGLPPEYLQALLPLADRTDIVVAPIAGSHPPGEPAAPGFRGKLIRLFRGRLAALQRSAPGPDAINRGIRHHFADFIYALNASLAGQGVREAWQEHTRDLTQAVLELARRDPEARILVVVNVRHCHLIRSALRKYPEVAVVDYSLL